MAKQKVVGVRKTVQIWVSGSHALTAEGAVHVHIENNDREDQKSGGYQHEAAYRSLIDLMVGEHLSSTTELLIRTGNDVLFRGLTNPRLTDKEHLHRHEELVEAMRVLFDVVRIRHEEQHKAVPARGSALRKVLSRPLGHKDGQVI